MANYKRLINILPDYNLKEFLWGMILMMLAPAGLGQNFSADFTVNERKVCSGSSVVFTDKSSDTNPGTDYYWDFGVNASPETAIGAGPHTVTYTGSGSNTVSLTLTRGQSDTETKKDYIEIHPTPPPPQAVITQPVCETKTGTIEIISPVGKNYEYKIDDSKWQSSVVFDNLAPGSSYTISVRDKEGDKKLDCNSSASFTINPYVPAPVAPGVSDVNQPDCDTPTGSITLTGLPSEGMWTITSGGGFNHSGTGTSTVITNLQPGTYSFFVTNEEGCRSGSTAEVTINDPPSSPSRPEYEIDCSNSSITITSPAGQGFEYSLNGGAYQSSTVFNNVSNGTYNITVRNSEGCTANTGNFTVNCGCDNPPVLNLSDANGVTCVNEPLTVAGNTFGGSATNISITENGAGSVSLSSANSSPFSFTYNPSPADAGETVIITISTNNPSGAPCEEATASYTLEVNEQPGVPVISNITQPTCDRPTGRISLEGLPSEGVWTISSQSGSHNFSGTGTNTNITNLQPGTYNFFVTNEEGCRSGSTAEVTINDPPSSPSRPEYEIDCSNSSITITSPAGQGFEYSLNGGAYQSSTVFNNVFNGTYNITVRNSEGCTANTGNFTVNCGCDNPPVLNLTDANGVTCVNEPLTVPGNTFGGSATNISITENGAGSVSLSSANSSPFSFTYNPSPADAGKTVVITISTNNPSGEPCTESVVTYTLSVNDQPNAPAIDNVTQPTCDTPTGSVMLDDLPDEGTWTLTMNPGQISRSGNGNRVLISDLSPGTYSFVVRNEGGCVSESSDNVVLNEAPESPPAPEISIDCSGGANQAIIEINSPTGAGYEYSIDDGAFQNAPVFNNVANGTHRISVRNAGGCTTEGAAFSINCGCADPPELVLASEESSTCGTDPVTISGNTFGGSAANVNISADGAGTISPSTANSSPFSYTYSPVPEDEGKVITITITTDTPPASACEPVSFTHTLNVHSVPGAPGIGAITQPDCENAAGSVILNNLPPGNWTITQNPGKIAIAGSGNVTTISGLDAGTYTFSVSNDAGCSSEESVSIVIDENPSLPTLIINDPLLFCSPETADLTDPSVTSGSDPDLSYSYWSDSEATDAVGSPGSVTEGTYYIKAVDNTGCTSIKDVNVTILDAPVANAGPDQHLEFENSTFMEANSPGPGESGLWTEIRGNGSFADVNDPYSRVSNLSGGENVFVWTISNEVCPPAYDTVTIIVQDVKAPTLITPNGDGINDYLEFIGPEPDGRVELIVFNRYGTEVFRDSNYQNNWNGVDQDGNPLPEDIYFYIYSSEFGNNLQSYIEVRR